MTYLCRKERCSALLAENLRWPSAHLTVIPIALKKGFAFNPQ